MNLAGMNRRKLLLALASIPLITLSGCVSNPPKKEVPIEVDVKDVKDVPTLIAAIRKSAGNLLPSAFKDEDFYDSIAEKFVANARAAADLGYKIPQWVLDKLPYKRKVVLPFLGIALFTYAGIAFAVPVSTVILAVLASIVLMTVAIGKAIAALFSDSKPAKT